MEKYDRFLDRYNWTPFFDNRVRNARKKVFTQIRYRWKQIAKNLITFLKIGNPRPYISPYRRQISYYYDYIVKVYGGTAKLLFRRIENDKNSKDQGPLRNSNVCQYVGNTPFYPGEARGKHIIGNNRFWKYYTKNIERIKKLYPDHYRVINNEIINYREVISGGNNTNRKLLKLLATDNGCKLDVHQILNTLNKSGFFEKTLKLPFIDKFEAEELDYKVKINPKASPGIFTKFMHGRTRLQSVRYSLKSAKRIIDIIKKHPFKNFSLWETLSREKDVKLVEGDEIATRLVVSMEEAPMLVCSLYSQKLLKGFQNIIDSPIFCGKAINCDNTKTIAKLRDRRQVNFASDWSNFDLYVSKDIILAAFAILRTTLPDGKFFDRLHYYIYKTMQEKFIVVNPGYVYKISKGFMSGHPLTSLMGSLINLIYWELIFYEVYGDGSSKRFDMCASGDDSIIFCDYSDRLQDIDQIIEDLGLKCDKLAGTMVFPKYVQDYKDYPSFLQNHIVYGYNNFTIKRLVRRLLYPTKKREHVYDDISLLNDYLDTYPFDDTYTSFILDYLESLHSSIEGNPFEVALQRRRIKQLMDSKFSVTRFSWSAHDIVARTETRELYCQIMRMGRTYVGKDLVSFFNCLTPRYIVDSQMDMRALFEQWAEGLPP